MDTQKLKADHGTIRWDGERLTGTAPDFSPRMLPDPICATGATPANAEELVRRWNVHQDLVAKLEELELRATQARIASNIGQPRLKDADFLRSEMERIGQSARTLLQTLKA